MLPNFPYTTARLLSLLVVMASLLGGTLGPAIPRPARAAPSDTPVTIVTDNVEEWAVGAGLLYWAHNCFADEFNPIAMLKRKPVGGGVERTLESINDFSRCITYQNLLSSADGLYYFDASQGQIKRMPLSEPYTPQVVKTLNSNQFPSISKPFVEANDYLYWIHPFNKVYRVRKDGSGAVQTVANTNATPGDVMVLGSTVYWADSTGIWMTSVTCDTLPCTGSQSQFSNIGPGANPYGMLYQWLGGRFGAYRIYWVERVPNRANNDYLIRYRACNQMTVCFVLPPPGHGAGPHPPSFTPARPTGGSAILSWRITTSTGQKPITARSPTIMEMSSAKPTLPPYRAPIPLPSTRRRSMISSS